jgi:hypothetical protein
LHAIFFFLPTSIFFPVLFFHPFPSSSILFPFLFFMAHIAAAGVATGRLSNAVGDWPSLWTLGSWVIVKGETAGLIVGFRNADVRVRASNNQTQLHPLQDLEPYMLRGKGHSRRTIERTTVMFPVLAEMGRRLLARGTTMRQAMADDAFLPALLETMQAVWDDVDGHVRLCMFVQARNVPATHTAPEYMEAHAHEGAADLYSLLRGTPADEELLPKVMQDLRAFEALCAAMKVRGHPVRLRARALLTQFFLNAGKLRQYVDALTPEHLSHFVIDNTQDPVLHEMLLNSKCFTYDLNVPGLVSHLHATLGPFAFFDYGCGAGLASLTARYLQWQDQDQDQDQDQVQDQAQGGGGGVEGHDAAQTYLPRIAAVDLMPDKVAFLRSDGVLAVAADGGVHTHLAAGAAAGNRWLCDQLRSTADFAVGMPLQVRGLVASAALNGCACRITRPPNKAGRWGVRINLPDKENRDGKARDTNCDKAVRIHASNLAFAHPAVVFASWPLDTTGVGMHGRVKFARHDSPFSTCRILEHGNYYKMEIGAGDLSGDGPLPVDYMHPMLVAPLAYSDARPKDTFRAFLDELADAVAGAPYERVFLVVVGAHRPPECSYDFAATDFSGGDGHTSNCTAAAQAKLAEWPLEPALCARLPIRIPCVDSAARTYRCK